MNELSICVPTLNRYDCLDSLIDSIRQSIVLPTDLWLIDNGQRYMNSESLDFIDYYGICHHYRKFGQNIGCAASWNWFIAHTHDIRIIVNDDITFTPSAIGQLVDAFNPNALVSPDSIVGSNSFSCFMIPDNLVENVGYFDESISPGWAFFEDNDYYYRMCLAGYKIESAPNCLVEHGQSSTFKAFSEEEKNQHHERFRLAQSNYQRKWGNLPHQETFKIPYNGVNS